MMLTKSPFNCIFDVSIHYCGSLSEAAPLKLLLTVNLIRYAYAINYSYHFLSVRVRDWFLLSLAMVVLSGLLRDLFGVLSLPNE